MFNWNLPASKLKERRPSSPTLSTTAKDKIPSSPPITPLTIKKSSKEATPPSPISISYRTDGKGEGAFYDHTTLRAATGRTTTIASPDASTLTALESYIQKPVVRKKELNLKLPISSAVPSRDNSSGLLYLPGRPRDASVDQAQRDEHEVAMLKKAKNTGRPVLAVCAGSWQLWQAYGGTLRDVSAHCYRAGMPSLKGGGGVGYNKMVHRIRFTNSTLLKKIALGKEINAANIDQTKPQVNSVHWRAPDENNIPNQLSVSAYSVRDDAVAPKSHVLKDGDGKASPMPVEEDTIEAFETNYGTPHIGILWHPEAFDNTNSPATSVAMHQRTLRYMAQAGDTFDRKKVMHTDLLSQGMFKPAPEIDRLIAGVDQLAIEGATC